MLIIFPYRNSRNKYDYRAPPLLQIINFIFISKLYLNIDTLVRALYIWLPSEGRRLEEFKKIIISGYFDYKNSKKF